MTYRKYRRTFTRDGIDMMDGIDWFSLFVRKDIQPWEMENFPEQFDGTTDL